MGFAELFLIAVGLSMDAFAVSVCKGLCMKRLNMRQALVIALFFGGFQGLMPLLGWALGTQFERFITPVDHWIAFALLAFIGAKMLWDGLHGEGCEECGRDAAQPSAKLDLRELVMISVATSIDALAVGITFAFLRVDIGLSARPRSCCRSRAWRWATASARASSARPRSPAASRSSSSAPRSCWNTSA